MYDLIWAWEILNKRASRLLREHEDFKTYDLVRMEMDNIERVLWYNYGFDIDDIE